MATLPLKEPHDAKRSSTTDHSGTNGADTLSPAELATAVQLYQDMQLLACLDHGYVKITPKDAGETLHLTFTWTWGHHEGHYVYVKSEAWNIRKAVNLLIWKIDACDQGSMRPARDKYYTK